MSDGFRREPIAVTGMSCRFAGADSVAELWDVLRNGADTTSETPKERYDLDVLYSRLPQAGKVNSRRAGYLTDAANFDADFFGMTAEEARHLDPQQRLLMTTAWEALEDAGVPAERIAGSRTGVYVGAAYADYWDLHTRSGLEAIDVEAIYNFRSLLPARLSFLFDLRGPSICIDTACSSSLVALHLACQGLRAGETTMALAAGVNLKLIPDRDILFSRARVLAPDGRCKFGDAAADGAAFSDGVGVVVLKPLHKALADGDRVRAVILGGAVSNDGASSGSLLTPSVEGHAQMLRWAYDNACVNPADVDFVEAHGTGTPMIDPVEFAGLNEVLGSNRPKDRPCYVGSVKANIGHAESAAGIASLIKTVLCLEHQEIVASPHFATPNPDIHWNDIPFTVPTASVPLPDRGRPSIAGISGQGISCVNVHLVLGQADPVWSATSQPAEEHRQRLLLLSARTPAALNGAARAYIRYLQPCGAGHQLKLRDICYSAAIRRTHHHHRLAVAADTHDLLIAKLQSFLAGKPAGVASSAILRSFTPDEDVFTDSLASRMHRVAVNYTLGQPVQWDELAEPGARYVPLPTYPWQSRRYWIDAPAGNHHRYEPSATPGHSGQGGFQ